MKLAPAPSPALSLPEPVHMPAGSAWCFGLYQAPAGPPRDLAVVLCRPLGWEALCSWGVHVQMSESLAARGIAVMRLDYHGTGDSAGDDADPRRIEAWLDSIVAAIERVRAHSGCSRVALVGTRMGALLAALAAQRAGGVHALALWAPPASGRAYTRELRAGGTARADGSLRVHGYHHGAETLQALQQLELTTAGQCPAEHALLVPRDDIPGAGPLPARLAQLGVSCTVCELPGYAEVMKDPSDGIRDVAAGSGIVDWLCALPAAKEPVATAVHAPIACSHGVDGGVCETPLRTATGAFGILAEPLQPLADDAAAQRRARTGVLLLNVGGIAHVGPHRNYVTLARAFAQQGYRALRLDIAGVGDSPAAPGTAWNRLYCEDSCADVSAAIDTLWAQGCREFVAMGICSGSYLAFQTAQLDARIGMQVLCNSRLLEWHPDRPGDTWHTSMQQYVKSTDYYLQALRTPRAWLRLLRGEIDWRPIARRFRDVALAQLQRAWRALTRHHGEGHSVLEAMRRLCERGTSALVLVSDEDDGRDYLQFHFGRNGRRMRRYPHFEWVPVARADHTFSDDEALRFVSEAVLRSMERRPPAQRLVNTTGAPRSMAGLATGA